MTLRSHFISVYSSPQCLTLCGRAGTKDPDRKDTYVTASGRVFKAYPVGLPDVEVTCEACRGHPAAKRGKT